MKIPMVGCLMNQLEATGRSDNGIVVLWTDHGYSLRDENATVNFARGESQPCVVYDRGPGASERRARLSTGP